MGLELALLFASATQTFNLPPKLLDSLCFVESSHRVFIVHKDDGKQNSMGICQVQLPTARMLGYKGTERGLLDPATNIHYAAKYLRKQLDRYGQNLDKAIASYNAGSYRLRQGHVVNQTYIKRVRKTWNERYRKVS